MKPFLVMADRIHDPDLLAIYDKKLGFLRDPAAKKEIQYKIGQLYEDEIADADDVGGIRILDQ